MESLKEYDIAFVKLKPGEHQYTFNIGKPFFLLKENSLIEDGKINVHLILDKKERLMNLSFQFDGYVTAECDVCLDPFKLGVKGNGTLHVKIVEEPKESDDEILYMGPHDSSFNVYDTIYEMLCTSLPMSKTCKDNLGGPKACNPEMLKFLSEKDANEPKEELTDPRWDKLKNIKIK